MSEKQTPQVIPLGSRQNEESLLGGRACAQGKQLAIPFCRFGISKKGLHEIYFDSRTWILCGKKLNEN